MTAEIKMEQCGEVHGYLSDIKNITLSGLPGELLISLKTTQCRHSPAPCPPDGARVRNYSNDKYSLNHF